MTGSSSEMLCFNTQINFRACGCLGSEKEMR
jgi:hypothetical protein